jgi:structural maintenance of chromosome 2
MRCISYNPFYDKSIKSVFGDVFICDDAETAKKLAFDPRMNIRCVTLDGLVYNSDGVITGGQETKK